jgi:hypothetical protein
MIGNEAATWQIALPHWPELNQQAPLAAAAQVNPS